MSRKQTLEEALANAERMIARTKEGDAQRRLQLEQKKKPNVWIWMPTFTVLQCCFGYGVVCVPWFQNIVLIAIAAVVFGMLAIAFFPSVFIREKRDNK